MEERNQDVERLQCLLLQADSKVRFFVLRNSSADMNIEYLYSRIPFFGRDLLKFCTYCFLKLELLILFLTEELQVDILCLQREAAETKIASLLGVSTLGLSSLRTDLLAVRSQVNIPRFLRTFGIKIDPNISVGSRSRVIERTC